MGCNTCQSKNHGKKHYYKSSHEHFYHDAILPPVKQCPSAETLEDDAEDPCANVPYSIRVGEKFTIGSSGSFVSPCASRWAQKDQYLHFAGIGDIQITAVDGDNISYRNISAGIGTEIAAGTRFSVSSITKELLDNLQCTDDCECDDVLTTCPKLKICVDGEGQIADYSDIRDVCFCPLPVIDNQCIDHFVTCFDGKPVLAPLPQHQFSELGSNFGVCLTVPNPSAYYVHPTPIFQLPYTNNTDCDVIFKLSINEREFSAIDTDATHAHWYIVFINGVNSRYSIAESYTGSVESVVAPEIAETQGLPPEFAIPVTSSAGSVLVERFLAKGASISIEIRFFSIYGNPIPTSDTVHTRMNINLETTPISSL